MLNIRRIAITATGISVLFSTNVQAQTLDDAIHSVRTLFPLATENALGSYGRVISSSISIDTTEITIQQHYSLNRQKSVEIPIDNFTTRGASCGSTGCYIQIWTKDLAPAFDISKTDSRGDHDGHANNFILYVNKSDYAKRLDRALKFMADNVTYQDKASGSVF